ncbi:outer membrane protein OmpA-like peptidoglycan-associated protein [Azospirillum agricola]|uniref:OmpA family protein n=1 Tax=Azospirillum agricola TaxID=1720247 RepID=UPI001AE55252|nr:OmpA family protein [Azospirillum agricola]MBP2230033.1 outer membrane protein OmpA-like peptidoglycan-associated protein [Azospirillum agricola]
MQPVSLLKALPLVAMLAGTAHADCASATASLDAAIQTRDAARIIETANALLNEAACPGAERLEQGRRSAIALSKVAEPLPVPERRRLLNSALQLSPTLWLAHARLGLLDYEAREYAEAQGRFERALAYLNDPQISPEKPPPGTLENLRGYAQQARLLAVRSSRGDSGILDVKELRGGIKVRRAPVPVRFDYEKAEFTDVGRRDAAFLRDILRDKQDPAILLVGHTDPKGADDYNCDLSWRRMQALADFLRRQGYRGSIEMIAMGKRQPLPIIGRENHSEDEIHQMLRRVEFYLPGDEKPETANACRRS